MRQFPEPLASEGVDLVGVELVGKLLHQLRIGTGSDAVVEGLEVDATTCEATLEILVTVEAELAVVGKIGAELQEERPEVAGVAVKVVLVDRLSCCR
ncbi:hypothetical protein D3C83_98650 [compost metagenome]